MIDFSGYRFQNDQEGDILQAELPLLTAKVNSVQIYLQDAHARLQLQNKQTIIYAGADTAEQEISFSFSGIRPGMYGHADKLFCGLYQHAGSFYWSVAGWVHIEEYDYINQRISGTFQFLGRRTGLEEIVEVTEGDFRNLPF